MQSYSGCIVVETHENTLLDCVRFAIDGNSVSGRDGDKPHFVQNHG